MRPQRRERLKHGHALGQRCLPEIIIDRRQRVTAADGDLQVGSIIHCQAMLPAKDPRWVEDGIRGCPMVKLYGQAVQIGDERLD
jgi:hypothetical protein